MRVPADHPVKPLRRGTRAYTKASTFHHDDAGDLVRPTLATCGTCGRSWDDAIITSLTPAPAARCPFEYFH